MQVPINIEIIVFWKIEWKIEDLEDQAFLEFQKIKARINFQLQLSEDRRLKSFKFKLYLRENIKGVNTRDCIFSGIVSTFHLFLEIVYAKFNSTNYIYSEISCE